MERDMKNLKIVWIFAFLAVFFVACGGDDETSDPSDTGNNKTCESNLDCPVGLYCDSIKKTCTDGSDTGDSGQHGGDIGDTTNPDTGDSTDPDTGDTTDPDTGYTPPSDECSATSTSCTPGNTCRCPYQGDPSTENVGECRAGVRTCNEDGTWSRCAGEVNPVPETGELCSNGKDDDCNGKVDDGTDLDGDGYGACTDCCETAENCNGLDPAMIYPGGVEIAGDGVDNNCNGEVDESTSCDGEDAELMLEDYAGNAVKLAHAMGICGDQLVSATLSLAGEPVTETINGSARQSLPLPYYDATYKTFAAATKFGNNIVPKEGSKIAILSTGPWDKPTKNASYATLAAGDMRTASKIPSDWINMMPNCTIPKSPTCGGTAVQEGLTNQCDGKTIPSVQDPIMLTLEVKVPMNARAFEFNLFFFSVEYPSTVCSPSNYNDFFIALLDSGHNTQYPDDEYQNPYDKNLAKDYNGNFVGVDLAPEGLFTACYPNSSYDFASYCTDGSLIDGTGFDAFSPKNGGTGWLVTRGNVVPGETMKLRLALWEQGTVGYGPDHSWDSTVLLDGFKWLSQPAKAGTGQQ